MLNKEQLERLLSELESDQVERTESTTNTDKFAEAICAFANDLPKHCTPGYLLIGVKNDGTLAGITVTDELLKNLGGIRSDGNILPQPMLVVDKFSLVGGEVAVVEVHPSDLPPVRYKGRVWIRVGPRKAVANEQEERLLTERRISMARSFDARPCSESKLGDLALGQFDSYRREAVDADTIVANHRNVEQQLASLRLFDPEKRCATNAGILLVGKNPRFFLPGAYVQYLQLPATSLIDKPVDQAEVSGDLYSVVKELEGRLKLLIKTSMKKISMLQEARVFNYPESAIRELLLNAVMHRNYDSNTPISFYAFTDRIEIQNPGGLYGEATKQNFPNRNSYRNPVIAEALKYYGFVEKFGSGVQQAQNSLKENGNPPAEFEFDEYTTLVKIFKN